MKSSDIQKKYNKQKKLLFKYNHHYFSSYLISKKHLSFFPKLEIGDKNWRHSIQNNKPILFMPLQMYPECPIDYWVKEIKFTNNAPP